MQRRHERRSRRADPFEMRDVRQGGRWSAGQRVKNDALYASARGALLLGRLPRTFLTQLRAALAALTSHVAPGLRAIALAQLERAFPEKDSRALARAHFVALGRGLGD